MARGLAVRQARRVCPDEPIYTHQKFPWGKDMLLV